jgi:hypothetical protein
MYSAFSKCGMILQDAEGQPRIKLYTDENGKFKGEALVVFLQEESVGLAERLMDDTELRLGEGGDRIVVKKAEWSHKAADDAATRAGGGGDGGSSSKPSNGGSRGRKGKGGGDPEKQRAQRRAEKQKRCVSMLLSPRLSSTVSRTTLSFRSFFSYPLLPFVLALALASPSARSTTGATKKTSRCHKLRRAAGA